MRLRNCSGTERRAPHETAPGKVELVAFIPCDDLVNDTLRGKVPCVTKYIGTVAIQQFTIGRDEQYCRDFMHCHAIMRGNFQIFVQPTNIDGHDDEMGVKPGRRIRLGKNAREKAAVRVSITPEN